MNADFGLLVNEPFMVISQLPEGRYLDLVARNMVIKTRNGFPSQEWYFHQQSRTIKNKKNNLSWDIQNAGKTTNMQTWNTNSGWF